jgi:hypothetical protein
MIRLIRRTAHQEAARRAPAEFDAGDLTLVAYFCVEEGGTAATLPDSKGQDENTSAGSE